MNEPESNRSSRTLAPDYFEGVYAASEDPWGFESRVYERSKYARTLAALPHAHYARGLEIGCSIGVLTRQLAARCTSLLAVDVNDTALQIARRNGAAAGNVEWLRLQMPQELPEGRFDLIMVSEVAYYWSVADLTRMADWMVQRLNPGGAIVLVHWTDPVADYPLRGDFVHAHFIDRALSGQLRRRYGEWHPRYRVDVFEPAGTEPPEDEAP
ncbi:MAG: nodulation S family protein [Pseudomonadota bacterium]|nr:nodulation S family protein [Pseudomonadota bacterium]